MQLSRTSEDASIGDILTLAAQFRDAAVNLGEASPMSAQLPLRLLALHSIELYLNALLLAKGLGQTAIHGLQHDLGERSRIAIHAGLVLRKRTVTHLVALSVLGEYRAVRYAHERSATLSQTNRMLATLDELSKKVRRILKSQQKSVSGTSDITRDEVAGGIALRRVGQAPHRAAHSRL